MFQTTVSEVLIFLTELHQAGKSYSSLNLARSALSAFVTTNDGDISNCSLISRFMKGVFNERPPKPRYHEIWDVKPVLDYLRRLSPVQRLDLKELTLKSCMLVALLSAQRTQSLALMSLDKMSVSGSNITFAIDELIKQSKPGNVGHQIKLVAYPPDRRLCIQTVLNEYVSRTATLRDDEPKLFISFKPPHKKVSKDTIARWIRIVLQAAGIDTTKFKAHSTRAAASSAAMNKFVPIDEIMKTAGWSNEKTFQVFYNKCSETTSSFAAAILND